MNFLTSEIVCVSMMLSMHELSIFVSCCFFQLSAIQSLWTDFQSMQSSCLNFAKFVQFTNWDQQTLQKRSQRSKQTNLFNYRKGEPSQGCQIRKLLSIRVSIFIDFLANSGSLFVKQKPKVGPRKYSSPISSTFDAYLKSKENSNENPCQKSNFECRINLGALKKSGTFCTAADSAC